MNSPATDAAYGVPLLAFLVVAAALFCLGLFAALRRSNVILILMGVELMLNAVNLNLVAFARYAPAAHVAGGTSRGFAFAVFVLVVAAAEAAVGLALAIIVSRRRKAIAVERLDVLKG
jgi:NADH-quinone oxidoreductase subunit K